MSDAIKARLWRSQSEFNQAQLVLERTSEWKTLQKASEATKAASAEWRDTCGEKFQPTTDQNGEPICVEKPANAK